MNLSWQAKEIIDDLRKERDALRSQNSELRNGHYSPLSWQQSKPTIDGYYYIRTKNDKNDTPDVVHVFRSSKGGEPILVLRYFRAGPVEMAADDLRFEWAGPLPEPEPPPIKAPDAFKPSQLPKYFYAPGFDLSPVVPIVSPSTHRYIGMFRPPFDVCVPPACDGGANGVVCHGCGVKLFRYDPSDFDKRHWGAAAFEHHYLVGHFDFPQYVPLEKAL